MLRAGYGMDLVPEKQSDHAESTYQGRKSNVTIIKGGKN